LAVNENKKEASFKITIFRSVLLRVPRALLENGKKKKKVSEEQQIAR